MYIILVYDIEVKRVAKVCKYLRQHLNWIQNSVFEGQLTKAQFARVKSGLAEITDPEKDSVIIYQLRDAKWMTKIVLGLGWLGCRSGRACETRHPTNNLHTQLPSTSEFCVFF